MSLNMSHLLQKLSFLGTSGLLASIFLSFPTFAVQPMSESDLEIVSATTGSNILNIFGASQAGLKIDDSGLGNTESKSIILNTERFNEGEATKPVALNSLRSIEVDNLKTPNNYTDFTISNDAQKTVLKINEQTSGNASAFNTSSEINYKTSNVHHDMRYIENGGVAVSRDMQIDLLKIENLRGDSLDDGRSAGSIFLSDWRSQGDTRIITSD
ncbi:MAG: hypothetical protein ACI8O8_000673 [Oleiphilaceae bacterium]|jgi:hypothetical protein